MIVQGNMVMTIQDWIGDDDDTELGFRSASVGELGLRLTCNCCGDVFFRQIIGQSLGDFESSLAELEDRYGKSKHAGQDPEDKGQSPKGLSEET